MQLVGGLYQKRFRYSPTFMHPKHSDDAARRAKAGRGRLRHGPFRSFPLFASCQEELSYVVARGDQPPLERHLLKAP